MLLIIIILSLVSSELLRYTKKVIVQNGSYFQFSINSFEVNYEQINQKILNNKIVFLYPSTSFNLITLPINQQNSITLFQCFKKSILIGIPMCDIQKIPCNQWNKNKYQSPFAFIDCNETLMQFLQITDKLFIIDKSEIINQNQKDTKLQLQIQVVFNIINQTDYLLFLKITASCLAFLLIVLIGLIIYKSKRLQIFTPSIKVKDN